MASNDEPVVLIRTRPSGAATTVASPLSRTCTPCCLASARAAPIAVRADVVAEPGELAVVRRQQRGGVPLQPLGVLRAEGEAVGIHQHRDVLVEDRLDRLRREVVGADTGADHPGLHPAGLGDIAALELGDDRLRRVPADLLGSVRRPREPDHARARRGSRW